LSPAELLASDCSYDFFAALDDLIVTGPTGTNVNDLRVILVDAVAMHSPIASGSRPAEFGE
jgi:hydroxypyruvate reductase